MMPDKVYLEEGCSVPVVGFVSPAWNNPKDKENTVEYIRKDALLKKLEKVAASYKKRSDEGELVWQNMCGINEAINILNEM